MRAPEGDQGWQPQGGVPGKRTAVPEGRPVDPVTAFLRRVDTIGGRLDGIAARQLPAMRAASTARAMNDARRTGGDLAAALDSVDADLAAMKQQALLMDNAAAFAMLAPLEARRDACRADAAPLLAQVPPPAPALSLDAAFAPHLCLEELAQHDAAEAETRAAWSAELDAREDQTPAATNVIDAGDRFRRNDDAPAAVQRRTAGSPTDPETVHAHAAAGVAGTGSSLPHLDPIQRSFGAHDVSGIRAHVGGPAADASAAIGAEAYATGTDVAFASSPSLFVAAHEATHVVQQRTGVSLLGGVGEAGDAYEQHADAVAEAVVRGESAEGLLRSEIRSGPSTAVQRKENGADKGVNLKREHFGNDQAGGGHRPADAPTAHERDKERASGRDMLAVEDQIRPLIFAALSARTTLEQMPHDDDLALALDIGMKGCEAITRHLQEVIVAPLLGDWHLRAVSALVFKVAMRIDRIGMGAIRPVTKMLETLALVQSMFPEGAVPTIDSETQAEEVATKDRLPRAVTASSQIERGTKSIAFDLDLAVEAFRETLMESMDDAHKEAILAGTVSSVIDRIDYLAMIAAENDVGADLGNRTLLKATQHLRAVAQRFIYCAMYEPQLPKHAEALASALDPLFGAIGVLPLLVESGAPSEGHEADAVAANARRLRTNWTAFYEAQDAALGHLCDQPDPGATSANAWDQALMALLATSTFHWTIGLAGGAVGVIAEDRVLGGKTEKGAIKTASSDVVKGLAHSVIEGRVSAVVTNPKGPRIQYFQEQQLALQDLRTRHLAELDRREIQEANESPEGRAALKQQADDTEPVAAQIAEAYKTKVVQDWAIHLAKHAYGEDKDTGGVNLDQVGGFTGEPEDPDNHERGTGVLEIVVELGEPGTVPKVMRAVVPGLTAGDAAHLSNQTIGELQLPVQIRAFGDYTVSVADLSEGVAKTGAPWFLISRNREGKVWVSGLSDSGRNWLGDYTLSGAENLFRRLSGASVGTVESA